MRTIFLVPVAALLQPFPADAEVWRDSFASKTPSARWYVCHRPENSFRFGVRENGRTAMVSEVRPLPKNHALIKEKHSGCIADNGGYEGDRFREV
ncbi:hypothetical protein CPY51_28145 [Rhizobium tubonense]|uniref:Uncharacterized protein n=1 Tax=Rhizobium tubonense TaxID=484088 RepID=A0A2W4CC57_9HYPH|nr:hypothetical protein CPY51_28145 [Rhizobium tubonense]